MARRYLLRPLPPPGEADLPAELAHHLIRVMRLRKGAGIRLFDGAGQECQAELVEVRERGRVWARARIGAAENCLREPQLQLELAFGVPKGSRGDWVFEHGTELGIRRFRPLRTSRSQRGQSEAALRRWERILAAAAGQCDRAFIPDLLPPEDLTELLTRDDLPSERYLADGGGEQPPPRLGPATTGHALLLVGPEGGLSADELAAATARGFQRRGLGPTTLRSETAALVGAALLLALS